MSILVFNAGSTSLKFALFDAAASETLAAGALDWAHGDRRRADLAIHAAGGSDFRARVDLSAGRTAATAAIQALAELYARKAEPLPTIAAVGHRVVYGPANYAQSVEIDQAVKDSISRLAELAPLHNPPGLEAILAAEAALPEAIQVAVFDTAFYAHLPPKAYVYPLPYHWHADKGLRRYGFHGISQKYCTQRAAKLLGRELRDLRIVSCHLGGGCSAVAVHHGVAVATTMGFSPLEGLMMGTRSGSIDPGLLIHLQRSCGLTVDQLDEMLNHQSGLLGVSGLSPDHARLEEAAAQGNAQASLALEIFADRVRSTVGALSVGMGGVDVLIFTDRVGEGSAAMRAASCEGLGCLGLHLDPDRNAACRPDADIATADSPARILVIRTREEWMIARETRQAMDRRGVAPP